MEPEVPSSSVLTFYGSLMKNRHKLGAVVLCQPLPLRGMSPFHFHEVRSFPPMPLPAPTLRAGEEGGNRGWDGWMASLTQWTGVWANSRSWWRTGKLGMLQFTGSQKSDATNWLNNSNPLLRLILKSTMIQVAQQQKLLGRPTLSKAVLGLLQTPRTFAFAASSSIKKIRKKFVILFYDCTDIKTNIIQDDSLLYIHSCFIYFLILKEIKAFVGSWKHPVP